MSYARFGQDGSDVYVYLDSAGYLSCCGCSLACPQHGGGQFETTAEMLTHLAEHRAAGHVVPEDCVEGLIEEGEENDAWIAEQNP